MVGSSHVIDKLLRLADGRVANDLDVQQLRCRRLREQKVKLAKLCFASKGMQYAESQRLLP